MIITTFKRLFKVANEYYIKDKARTTINLFTRHNSILNPTKLSLNPNCGWLPCSQDVKKVLGWLCKTEITLKYDIGGVNWACHIHENKTHTKLQTSILSLYILTLHLCNQLQVHIYTEKIYKIKQYPYWIWGCERNWKYFIDRWFVTYMIVLWKCQTLKTWINQFSFPIQIHIFQSLKP